jgi:hypothetical protein
MSRENVESTMWTKEMMHPELNPSEFDFKRIPHTLYAFLKSDFLSFTMHPISMAEGGVDIIGVTVYIQYMVDTLLILHRKNPTTMKKSMRML